MILAVDIGNTETVIGLYRGATPVHCWRIATERRRTGDELALIIQGLLDRSLVPSEGPVRRAMLASVVPVMGRSWAEACRSLNLPHRFLTGAARLPIRLDVENPSEVGADRIANTLAAAELYARDTVVVDLGTATTYDCIGADGVFLGGVIAPGPRAGIERLSMLASHLPQVEIREPGSVIGRNTSACLESGVFYQTVDGIDGTVRRILEEWEPRDPLVVATGGLAELIAPQCRQVQKIEPFLTLTGLAIADRHLAEGEGEEGASGQDVRFPGPGRGVGT